MKVEVLVRKTPGLSDAENSTKLGDESVRT